MKSKVHPTRTQTGSAVCFGTAGTTLFGGLFVMLTVFTFNFGLGGYYQEKIHSVTRQALLCYAARLSWSAAKVPNVKNEPTPEEAVAQEVNQSLMAMGFPQATVTCNFKMNVATVKVSVQGFALFNGSTGFPTTINLQDSQSINVTTTRGAGMVAFQLQSAQTQQFDIIYVPSYGRFVVPYSNGQADLRSAPRFTATFYNAVTPYNQYNLQFLPGYGDVYSDNY